LSCRFYNPYLTFAKICDQHAIFNTPDKRQRNLGGDSEILFAGFAKKVAFTHSVFDRRRKTQR
jgi:hypothetical protein